MVKRVRDQSHEKEVEIENPPKRNDSSKRGVKRKSTSGSTRKRSTTSDAEVPTERRGRRRRTEAEMLEDRLTPHYSLGGTGEEEEEDVAQSGEFEKTVISTTVRRTFGYTPDERVHEERREYVAGRESPEELPARSRLSAAGRARVSDTYVGRREPITQPLARPNFLAASEEEVPALRRLSRRESSGGLTRAQRLQQNWTREAYNRGSIHVPATPEEPVRVHERQEEPIRRPKFSIFALIRNLLYVLFYPLIALARWTYSAGLMALDNVLGLGGFTLRPTSLLDRVPLIFATLTHPVTVIKRMMRRPPSEHPPAEEPIHATAEEEERPTTWWRRVFRVLEMVFSIPFLLAREVAYWTGFAIGRLISLPQWSLLQLRRRAPKTWEFLKKYKTPLAIAAIAVVTAWLLGGLYSQPKLQLAWSSWQTWKNLMNREWKPVKALWSGVTWFRPFQTLWRWLSTLSLPTFGTIFAGKQPWAPVYRPGGATMPKYMGSWTPERSYNTQREQLEELMRDIDHAQKFISQSKRQVDGDIALVGDKLTKLLQYQQLLSSQLAELETHIDNKSAQQIQVLVDEVQSMHDEAQQAHRLLLASTTELEHRFRPIVRSDMQVPIKNADDYYAAASAMIYQLEVESASLVNQLTLTANRLEIGLTKAEASEMVDSMYAIARERLQGRLEGSAADQMISRLVSEVAAELKASGGIVTIDRIKSRIDSILQEKIADVSLIDYAAASMGATIIAGEPYTSAPYVSFLDIRTRARYFLGLERAGATPEVVISHGKHTWRNCYAFKGDHGAITVKLVKPIIPTQIGVYHLLEQVAVHPETAPNKYRVWGWYRSPDPARTVSELPWPLNQAPHPPTERPASFDSSFYDGWNKHGPLTSDDMIFLGEYSYELSNYEALQVSLLDKSRLDQMFQPIQAITLEVMNNHGHSEYTCVYGVRVYGGDPENHLILH